MKRLARILRKPAGESDKHHLGLKSLKDHSKSRKPVPTHSEEAAKEDLKRTQKHVGNKK